MLKKSVRLLKTPFIFVAGLIIGSLFLTCKTNQYKSSNITVNRPEQHLKSNAHEGQISSNRSFTEEPEIRAQQLQNVCRKLKDIGHIPVAIPGHSYQYMYVNDEYKFIFCMMPKLACTNWKRIFLALSNKFPNKDFVINKMGSGDVHDTWLKYGNTLDKYSYSEIQKKLQTYKKLVFVRDPFERLLSAFKDKMFRKDPPFFRNIAEKIIRLKRSKEVNHSDEIKFVEFVKYLTDPDTFESSYEQHWAKYENLCQPCLVNYDFIGKFETMKNDISRTFKYLDIKIFNETVFPDRSVSYKNTESSKITQTFYNQLPEMYLKRLWHLYKIDFQMFSYQMPDFVSDIDE
ncbi:carbohydrate sulfotransferase 11-like [Mytilus trossulus]|uniref:carbohydrate sulfotransferase 11-like n=1 Tax=Mytilus trossulus TaxID=6551 RepID=UPI0030071C49